MPGAGTDKTKRWIAAAGAGGDPGRAAAWREYRRRRARHGQFRPVAAAAGQAARRLAEPASARVAASGADRILRRSRDLRHVGACDCRLHLSCWRPRRGRTIRPSRWCRRHRPRGCWRRGSRPARPSASCSAASATGSRTTRSRSPTAIVTLPVNPAFASLNLAQAVLVVAYEWFKLASGGALPFAMPHKSPPATKQQLLAFFAA